MQQNQLVCVQVRRRKALITAHSLLTSPSVALALRLLLQDGSDRLKRYMPQKHTAQPI